MLHRVSQYYLLVLISLTGGVWAQPDPLHTLSGYVEDAASGEKLIGAVLYEPTLFAWGPVRGRGYERPVRARR